MKTDDLIVLRDLAQRVAQIAADPINAVRKKLWYANNALRPERPMFMMDQLPWNEMDVEGELRTQCADPFCAGLETELRRSIYRWKHMQDDFVYEPVIHVPMSIGGMEFGISIEEDTIAFEQQNEISAHRYHDQLQVEEDLQKLTFAQVTLNEAETARRETIAHEAFDGVLEVVMDGVCPAFDAWDKIVEWRGADNMIIDFMDRPEFMHKIIARVTQVHLDMLDQLEEKGLLCKKQQTVHCSGAWSDELPKPGYDPQKPRATDIWGWGMAQIFTTVSPAMHREYEIEYAKKWYARFGMSNYGCCEPLDARLDIVKQLPNIRKISMSPWVKSRERAAETMNGEYVFLNKPSPSYLISDAWDETMVEQNLRQTRDICAQFACPLELVLKDVSTVSYKPQTLWKWAEIARRVCEG